MILFIFSKYNSCLHVIMPLIKLTIIVVENINNFKEVIHIKVIRFMYKFLFPLYLIIKLLIC